MAKDNSTFLLLAGGAAVAYYGYTRGWFATFGISPAAVVPAPSPAPTPVMPATSPASTPAAAVPPASTSSGGSAAAPTPSNTLAHVLSQLQKAEAAAYGSDPAFTGSAANPVATYDVHNWYLNNQTSAGLKDGQLQAPDHATTLSLTDYWAWAAPQVQQFTGLQGLGAVYSGLAEIARRTRGGW